MRTLRLLVAYGAAVFALGGACAHSNDPDGTSVDGADASTSSSSEAGGGDDAGSLAHDATSSSDGGHTPSDAAHAGDANGPAEGGGSGLDPQLALPGAGPTCSVPGSETGCPSLTVCRIATSADGRCEGCTTCGNLGAACSASDECDILFQCYAGQCTNICPLGTSYCGAVADCLDVGNAGYGVCKP